MKMEVYKKNTLIILAASTKLSSCKKDRYNEDGNAYGVNTKLTTVRDYAKPNNNSIEMRGGRKVNITKLDSNNKQALIVQGVFKGSIK